MRGDNRPEVKQHIGGDATDGTELYHLQVKIITIIALIDT
jgi:hypothetical protein